MEEMLKALNVYTTQDVIEAMELNMSKGYELPSSGYQGLKGQQPVDHPAHAVLGMHKGRAYCGKGPKQ